MIELCRKNIQISEQDCYDYRSPVRKWRDDLPHLEQDGKLYFVTIRLADSIPAAILSQHIEEYKALAEVSDTSATTEAVCERVKRLSEVIDKYVDQCYGACVFARPDVREQMRNVLLMHDGEDYDLYDYVIMPNHLHLLIKPGIHTSLKAIVSDMKRKSSYYINRLLGRSGKLWQRDYFDRIPRSMNDVCSIIEYIHENPAHLPDDTYHLAKIV